MHLEILRTLTDLDSLADEWNDLLDCCSASHVPFLRYEYLSTWWKTLGGGEWQDGELFTVLARQEDGALLGVAPLFFTHNQEGQPALLLLGSIEISDYLDLIVRTSEIPLSSKRCSTCWSRTRRRPGRCLTFYNLPETSPTLAALQEAAARRGWAYQQEQLQPCPYIPLPGDWEAYLASIDKKQRHEIRRKMRRAEESEPPVRWYIVQDEEHAWMRKWRTSWP